MGFELCRFDSTVDEELLCPICGGVLEAPVQAPACEHTFCRQCIEHWLKLNATCPIDRQPLASCQLAAAPRILRNLLDRLSLACEFAGCSARLKLPELAQHAAGCQHNPKRPVACGSGCGLVLPRDQLPEHNCVRAMRQLLDEQQAEVSELRCEQSALRHTVEDLRRQLMLLTAAAASPFPAASASPSRSGRPPSQQQPPPPHHQPPATHLAHHPVVSESGPLSWARSSLGLARVSRWGGVISTPDLVLQAVVRRALSESRCPPDLLAALMERAHESRWPAGVASLELRQANRRQYESYVIRRVPGKQAVVLLACENRHMPAEFVAEPGIVMIFAHGVD